LQRVVSFAQRKRNIIAAEYIDEGTLKIFLLSNSSLLYEEKIEVSSVSMEFFKNHLKEIATIYFKPDGLKKSNKVDKEDIDQSQIVFSYLQNNKDCVYVLIPDSWLREKNGEKLDKGLNKFVIKVIE
jgi:excinuclease ABC subunit C